MLSSNELTSEQLAVIERTVPGGARDIQGVRPLSALQEGMLIHSVVSEHLDTNVLSTLFELDSREDIDALCSALGVVMNRHDALRSAMLWENLPRPVQVICRKVALPIEHFVLDEAAPLTEQLNEQLRPYHATIELKRAPLIRLQIATRPLCGKFYAILRVHHLICDHGSLQVVIEEVMACLDGHAEKSVDHASRSSQAPNALMESQVRASEEFFRRRFAEVTEPTAPFGLTDVRADSTRIREAREMLGAALTQCVRSAARRCGVSSARLLHAAWALVVARTSGRDDVVFGTLVLSSHRRGVKARRAVDMSVNTLPLRLQIGGLSVEELVRRTGAELSELLQHETASLALAQRCSGMGSTSPLFTAILNYRHNLAGSQTRTAHAGKVRVLARGEALNNYPVTLIVDDLGEHFMLLAQTAASIDPQRLIGYVRTAIESLARALEHAPETPASSLAVLPHEEYRQVIELFNEPPAEYPEEKLLQELFEEHVASTPDSVAVIYEGQSLSFAQLNGRANQVARYLRSKGVDADQPVAICVERGLETVIGLLAILKAGGAYLPLDPSYPPERLQYMLKDAAPKVLLTQRRLKEALPLSGPQTIELDGDSDEIATQERHNLDARALRLTARNLAYVIYTSGSTGEPKGVAAEHRGMVNRIIAQEKIAGFRDDDICCQKTSVGFVDAIFEILGPLSYGRPLVVASTEAVKDVQRLAALIDVEGVTRLVSVPSLARSLIESAPSAQSLQSLHCWTLSGEELKQHLLRQLHERLPHCTFVNLYGSSEVAADVTCYVSKAGAQEAVTIGRPIANTRVYILDRQLQPVPIDVSGEIYIAGVCVARGYLNRPELTAQRFLPDPFATDPQARMYKSGDLGRWHADGTIEYLGRNDQQVKIRGFRVEVGEIEMRLGRHEQVKEAVVTVREDASGDQGLVAYIVPRDPAAAPSIEALRVHLKSGLPEYMVPSAFVMLDRLPLTATAKLDRRALPKPELADYTSRQYEPPQGEVEDILAGIWQSLLNLERVGRNDNFFELGGHSLTAMQANTRIRASLSVDISIKSLFELPTLSALSARIAELRSAQLLARLSQGDAEIEELLATLAEMPEGSAHDMLRELQMEGRL